MEQNVKSPGCNIINLIIEFLIIGLLTFGGGNSVIPIIKQRLIDKKHMLNEAEFYEIINISNVLPGPSMVEIASGIGYRLCGIKGAIFCAIAISLPCMILFCSVMMLIYNKLNPHILNKIILPLSIILAASMFNMGYDLLTSNKKHFMVADYLTIIIVIIAMLFFNISPIIIILCVMIINIIIYGVKKWLNI